MPDETIMEKIESCLQEMKAARESFAQEANQLQLVTKSFAEDIKGLKERVKNLEDGIKSLREELNKTKSSVKPLVDSGDLKKFVEMVRYKRASNGYDYFCFPNVYAWDIHAEGAFYSGHNFVPDAPMVW
jgi:hypothetical protein